MKEKPICRVGLVGAGVVGGGVAEILLRRADFLARRAGVRLELVRVAEKDRARAHSAGVPDSILVDDYRRVTAAPDVDVAVELVGGTGVARDVVRSALENGKTVVTANKALLATQGAELFSLARQRGARILFEASVCGGIPIILALRNGLLASRTQSLCGIVNGTCNYILTEMTQNNLSFEASLKGAQERGYAEANPATDVDGIDAGHKLAILSALAFDTWVDFPSLHVEGIRDIADTDVLYARRLGYVLKLLAVARVEPRPLPMDGNGGGGAPEGARLFLSVHPALLRERHPLARVNGSLNAVELEGDVVGESVFQGRGAGRYPTASAVVADLVEAARSETSAWFPPAEPAYPLAPMAEYRARYYLRFMVEDRPGTLGAIAAALGAHNVSIAAVSQFETEENAPAVPVVIVTHECREGDLTKALEAIRALPPVIAKPTLFRIEG